MAFHYIAVEGPIGVGKTTVVERLAEQLDANTVLEDWSTNPFLRPFYEGSDGASFQLELFFLLMRYRQQQELVQRQLFAQATLCDYVFEKSRLFAYLNLDDSELMIYEKLFTLLSDSVPRPDLVIYLQAPTDVLMKRVKTRAKASLIRGMTSNSGIAMQSAMTHGQTGDWRDIFNSVERIEAVTKEDILRVAREAFVASNRTVAKIVTEEDAAQ